MDIQKLFEELQAHGETISNQIDAHLNTVPEDQKSAVLALGSVVSQAGLEARMAGVTIDTVVATVQLVLQQLQAAEVNADEPLAALKAVA